MLVEDKTNNSTGADMENWYRKKGDAPNKIKKGIRFF